MGFIKKGVEGGVLTIRKVRIDHIKLSLISRSDTQARQADINAGIDDLVESIYKQGLLSPVSLVEIKENESYELIDGQRRLLAYQELERKYPERSEYSKIQAVIYANVMDDWEKKTISVNANITQEPMKARDKINTVTSLFKHFGGNMSEVARSTGFSRETVKKYVMYERLPKPLKEMYDDGTIKMGTALKIANVFDGVDVDEAKIRDSALVLAKLQQKQLDKVAARVKYEPNASISEIVKKVQNQKQKNYEIKVEVVSETYVKIDKFRSRNDTTIEVATVDLIEEGIRANEL